MSIAPDVVQYLLGSDERSAPRTAMPATAEPDVARVSHDEGGTQRRGAFPSFVSDVALYITAIDTSARRHRSGAPTPVLGYFRSRCYWVTLFLGSTIVFR